MKSGHESDVNSAGTRFSAFARIGAAAILIGKSISEKGSSGRVCCPSLETVVFLEEEQARKNTNKGRQKRSFNGYVFISKTKIIFL